MRAPQSCLPTARQPNVTSLVPSVLFASKTSGAAELGSLYRPRPAKKVAWRNRDKAKVLYIIAQLATTKSSVSLRSSEILLPPAKFVWLTRYPTLLRTVRRSRFPLTTATCISGYHAQAPQPKVVCSSLLTSSYSNLRLPDRSLPPPSARSWSHREANMAVHGSFYWLVRMWLSMAAFTGYSDHGCRLADVGPLLQYDSVTTGCSGLGTAGSGR